MDVLISKLISFKKKGSSLVVWGLGEIYLATIVNKLLLLFFILLRVIKWFVLSQVIIMM